MDVHCTFVGVPVLFGTHTHHFAEPAEALLRAGGGRRVRDAAGLAREAAALLADDERRMRAASGARRVIEQNRGAMARSVELVFDALEAGRR